MILEFGKYRGYNLHDVPEEYVEWLVNNTRQRLEMLQAEVDRREQIRAATTSMVDRVVEAGFRALAKKLHPDQGGSNEEMRELLDAYRALQSLAEELKS